MSRFLSICAIFVLLVSLAPAQEPSQWFHADPFLGLVTSTSQARVPFQGARSASGWRVRGGVLEYANNFYRRGMGDELYQKGLESDPASLGPSRVIAYHGSTKKLVLYADDLFQYDLEFDQLSKVYPDSSTDSAVVFDTGSAASYARLFATTQQWGSARVIPGITQITIGDTTVGVLAVNAKWITLDRALGINTTGGLDSLVGLVSFLPSIDPSREVTAVSWGDTTLIANGPGTFLYFGGVTSAPAIPARDFYMDIDSITELSLPANGTLMKVWSTDITAAVDSILAKGVCYLLDTTRSAIAYLGVGSTIGVDSTLSGTYRHFVYVTMDSTVDANRVALGATNKAGMYWIDIPSDRGIVTTNDQWEFVGNFEVTHCGKTSSGVYPARTTTDGGSSGAYHVYTVVNGDTLSCMPVGDNRNQLQSGIYATTGPTGTALRAFITIEGMWTDSDYDTSIVGSDKHAYKVRFQQINHFSGSGWSTAPYWANSDSTDLEGVHPLYRLRTGRIAPFDYSPYYVTMHSGRAWYAGVDGEETSVFYSDIRNYDSIVGYEVLEGIDAVRSLVEVGDIMSIGRTASMYSHTGYDELDFYYSRTPSPSGVRSFYSIARSDLQGTAYFVSPSGFYMLQGGQAMGMPVEFIDVLRDSIDWTAPETVCAVVFRGQFILAYTGLDGNGRICSIDIASETPLLTFISGPDVSSWVVVNPDDNSPRLFAGDLDSTILWEYIPNEVTGDTATWSTGWASSESKDRWMTFTDYAATIQAASGQKFIFQFSLNDQETVVWTDTVTTTSAGDTSFVNQLSGNLVGYSLSCTVKAVHYSATISALSVKAAPVATGGSGG